MGTGTGGFHRATPFRSFFYVGLFLSRAFFFLLLTLVSGSEEGRAAAAKGGKRCVGPRDWSVGLEWHVRSKVIRALATSTAIVAACHLLDQRIAWCEAFE